jgi:hypothetical protein
MSLSEVVAFFEAFRGLALARVEWETLLVLVADPLGVGKALGGMIFAGVLGWSDG